MHTMLLVIAAVAVCQAIQPTDITVRQAGVPITLSATPRTFASPIEFELRLPKELDGPGKTALIRDLEGFPCEGVVLSKLFLHRKTETAGWVPISLVASVRNDGIGDKTAHLLVQIVRDDVVVGRALIKDLDAEDGSKSDRGTAQLKVDRNLLGEELLLRITMQVDRND